jgi:hypothetical protein
MWFGTTGTSFFDRWSIVHLAFWFVACADMRARNVPALPYWLITVGVAYLWELFEWQVLEPHGWVKHPESPINRWVSDPLMAVLAGFAAWFLMKGQ